MASSKRILLVQPHLIDKEPPVYPLGLAYIAATLNSYHVRIFDMNVAEDPNTELTNTISSFQPDIVGVTLRNIDNQRRTSLYYYYKDFELLLKNIKAVKPDVKLIAGGPGFSMFAEEIMMRNPLIDFGVYLEGEESFPELVVNIGNPENIKGIFYRKNGIIKFTGKKSFPHFDALPLPRRDLLDISKYQTTPFGIGVQTKRGCMLKCAYCNYPVLNGTTMRLRSPEHVVNEIEELTKGYGITEFMFVDSVFNLPISHAKDICREMLKRGLQTKWSAWLDIRFIDDEFLRLAKKAGCISVAFSPDAVSQKALDKLKKGIKEKDISRTLQLFTQNKELESINVNFSIFINPPGSDFKYVFKAIFLYIKAKLILKGRGGVFLNWIRIEPDTEVYRMAIEDGVIDEHANLLPENAKDLHRLFYSHPSLKHADYIMLLFLKTISIIKKIFRRGKKEVSCN